jgi:hypothetical protein
MITNHDDDAAAKEHRRARLIQRDLVRLLRYLDSGVLESKQPSVQVVTLAFAISALAYLHGLDRDKLRDLVGAIIDEFDPDDVEAPKH